LIRELAEIYHEQEFLREAIQVIIDKTLRKVSANVATFDLVADSFLAPKDKADDSKKEKALESNVLSSSASLSMFLTLRLAYFEVIAPLGKLSKNYNELMAFDILDSTKQLAKALPLVKAQTYLYPRLHSSLVLLLEDLFRGDPNAKSNALLKKFKNINDTFLEASIFNEEVLASLKSVTRLKYLHIGLRIVEVVFKKLATLEGPKSIKIKAKVIGMMLRDSENFRGVLVRNVQTPKNQLHEAAKEAKVAVVQVLNQIKDSALKAEEGNESI